MISYNLLVLGAISLIISVLGLIFPKFFMTFGKNWMYDYDLEPSDFAIKVTKVISVICIIISVAMIVVGAVALANGDYYLSGLTM